MDTSPHTFSNLFRQLGLPAGRDDIVAFLARHHLEEGTALPDAHSGTLPRPASCARPWPRTPTGPNRSMNWPCN